MAEGLSSAAAQIVLQALANEYDFMQVHDGAPGANGTANVADETDRPAVTWDAASGNALTTSADVDFTSVAATETWTHCSFWTASSAGTFGFSGTISNGAVVIGADVTFAAGDIDVSCTLAS